MEKRPQIEFCSDYYVLAISHSKELLKESEIYCSRQNIGFRIYENPESTVVGIFEHPKHIEPLLTLMTDFHGKGLVESCFFGGKIAAFASEILNKSKGTFNLNIVDAASHFRLMSAESSNVPSKIEIFRLLGDLTVILYPSEEWKTVANALGASRISDTILSLSLLGSCEPLASAPKRSYHPIAARMSELKNQVAYLRNSCEGLLSAVKNLQNRSATQKTADVVTANVKYILMDLERVGIGIDDANVIQRPKGSIWFNPLAFRELLIVENRLLVIRTRISTIERALSQRVRLLKESGSEKHTMRLHGETDLLRCIELSIRDFFQSVDGIPRNPLLIFENEGPSCQFWNFGDPDRMLEESFCLAIPSYYMYRTGLIPLLAHTIAHGFLFMWRMKDVKPFQEIAIRLFDPIHKFMHTKKAEAYWIMEDLLADLVALSIAGASYLYTFARVSYNFSEESTKLYKDLSERSAQLLPSARLWIVSEALRSMGLLSRMTIPSALQDNEFLQAVFQPDLVSWILEMLSRNGLIANLYDSGEHELAIGKVKNSLKKGQVTPYRPRIILNALWDSVFDEQDYANEIAVIFSILNWEDTNK